MFKKDPATLLKQAIREQEDMLPQLNEGLAMIKAQVTLLHKDLERLQEKEVEIQEKVEDALGEGRPDKAACYDETLGEVRQAERRTERELAEAEDFFLRAQGLKRAFLHEKELMVRDAVEALAAKRRAEWYRQVAKTFAGARSSSSSGAACQDLVRRMRESAEAEAARLDEVLVGLGAPPLNADGDRLRLAALLDRTQRLELELRALQREVDALERRR